ncbi:MAG: ABC transporter substrate-binding protein [Halanaerobium sp.]
MNFKNFSIITIALVMVLAFSFSAAAQDTLVVNTYTSDPAPREAMQKLIAQYEEENPDVDVELNITAHEDFKQAIRVWLNSDSPPDVFTWFAGERANYFVERDLIMDITDVWEEENLYEKFPEAFQSISIYDDKAYFLPHNYYWWSVFYRDSIFEEYDLEEPETWDELLEVGETLKENGITPFAIGTKFRWTAAGWFDYLNLRINGADFHRELMAGDISFTDERVEEVFVKWKYLIENDFFIEDPAAYSWQEALQYISQGDAAMYLMGQFLLDATSEEVAEDIDFFRFPIIDEDVPVAEDLPTDGFMIPQNAENPELAKDFLAFLSSVEGQRVFAEDVGRLVTNKNMPDDIYTERANKGRKMVDETEELTQFYDRDMDPEFADKTMDSLMKFWNSPSDYESVMEEMEEHRQNFLD